MRLILCEDDALVRMTIAGLLTEFGYDVGETATGGEALDALAGGAALLIVDLNLPDMNGIDVANAALARNPELRVIVATGDSAPPIPGYVWLAKPFNIVRLRAALDAAMADRASPV